jgi:hypothetical protein
MSAPRTGRERNLPEVEHEKDEESGEDADHEPEGD